MQKRFVKVQKLSWTFCSTRVFLKHDVRFFLRTRCLTKFLLISEKSLDTVLLRDWRQFHDNELFAQEKVCFGVRIEHFLQFPAIYIHKMHCNSSVCECRVSSDILEKSANCRCILFSLVLEFIMVFFWSAILFQ